LEDKRHFYKLLCTWRAFKEEVVKKAVDSFCGESDTLTATEFIFRSQQYIHFFDVFGLREFGKECVRVAEKELGKPLVDLNEVPDRYS